MIELCLALIATLATLMAIGCWLGEQRGMRYYDEVCQSRRKDHEQFDKEVDKLNATIDAQDETIALLRKRIAGDGDAWKGSE